MNWEALGAIGETVGAIAVVVTLAYLAVQLRQTRISLQTQGTDRTMALYSTWRVALASNIDLARTIGKANLNEALAEEERIQLEAAADELFMAAGVSHMGGERSGATHDRNGEVRYLAAVLASNPGLIPHWHRFRPNMDEMSPTFAAKVAARLAERPL